MTNHNSESSIEQKERQLREAFANISEKLREWGQKVDEYIIQALTGDQEFDYQQSVKMPPSYRLKDIDSLIKKAFYRKPYHDPIKEIEDKVGTRIVVLTSVHVNQVKEVLTSRTDLWNCSIGRDKALIKESIKEFDYEAIHLIVSPKEGDVNESPLLTCEIQIKTLFQHAYSEISHDTVYKGPYRHDLELLRKMARSMALIESTDENFNSMYSYINSGRGLALNFLHELIFQFMIINPAYDVKKSDSELDSYILDELMDGNVLSKIEMAELGRFVSSDRKKLLRIHQKPNLLIGKHPVMILLGYILKYCPDYLVDRDIDFDILNSIALQLGVHYDPSR